MAVKNFVQQQILLNESERSMFFDCQGTRTPVQSLLSVKSMGTAKNSRFFRGEKQEN